MQHPGQRTPATLRRAFFVSAVLAATACAGPAPASRPPELAQFGKPDAEEAARLIRQVRQAGIPGDFYLQFELRAMPRRGEGRTFQGQLWGSRNEQGAVTRVEVTDAAGVSHRLLIQNGERASVWRLADGRATPLEVGEWFAPLIPGVEVSAFDLQMPFLYWPDAAVEKITRILGRPAHAFIFRPPEEFRAQQAGITGVRAYLDGQYNALVQTEHLGRDNRPTRTFSLISLKRIGDQPIPRQADFRNDVTRDKTRLQVTAAALDLKLPPAVFQPASLAQPAAAPAGAQIVRIDR
jgi:hypothetical protein